jgi:hypothetical protein
MSTQIVTAYEVVAFGSQPVATIRANFAYPTASIGSPGIVRDDQFLQFWGLRASADTTTVLGDGITVHRAITLQMGPSVDATAAVSISGGQKTGYILGIAIESQGEDYILPPIPVLSDATGSGAILGTPTLQVLATAQQIVGGSGYVAPVATARNGLAPGGIPATFSVTVVGGAITAVTCTNTTTNGPYAAPPDIVITDPSGAGEAVWIARMGVSSVPIVEPGTNYTAPTLTFLPYFKKVCPDTNPATQAAAVKGWMTRWLSQRMTMPVNELLPVVS